MPLPSGAHYEDRSRRTVRLSDGSVVRRQMAMNIGAREAGYRNDRDYRSARAELRELKQTSRGAQDVEAARARGYSQREIDKMLLEGRRLYSEGKLGRNADKRMGSWVQRWNAMTGRVSPNDWQAY